MIKLKSATILYLLVLLISITMYLYGSFSGSTLPFVGYHSFNFNIYSLIAHNYNQFGAWNTKLAPVISTAGALPESPTYYLHHPPMISIVESILFKAFGESFFVARLSVILFSVISVALVYLIGNELVDKKFGMIAASVASLMPATILFGRMVGQEALVMTFCLSSVYFVLLYLKSARKIYLALLILSIILGTLSDWPMVYFVVALFPYFLYRKNIRLYLFMLGVAVITAILYLLYIFLILSSYDDLIQAIIVRSFDAYSINGLWYVKWVLLIGLRLAVYFNPLFLLAGALGIWRMLRNKIPSHNFEGPLYFSLCLFGFTHVLLYPAGSFGHPYWIYYLLPGFTFLSARGLYNSPKYIFLTVMIISLLYSIKVIDWKTGEMRSNVWRYALAEKVSEYVPRYATVASASDPAIDLDVLRYAFLIDYKIVEPEKLSDEYSYYLISCVASCADSIIEQYAQLWQHEVVHSKITEGEMYLFYLDSPVNLNKSAPLTEINYVPDVSLQNKYYQYSLRDTYSLLSNWLGAPQI